ncbi:MAG: hypothetical protein ACM3N4_03550 [Nitrososphaerota archaeon]
MSDEQNSAPKSWADERDRRIEALRRLSQADEQQYGASPAALPSPAQQPIPPTMHSSRKLFLIAISALALVTVVGGLVAHSLLSSPSSVGTRPPAVVTFSPDSANVTCLRDIAWSPDSTMIAVLGYQVNCASDNPTFYSYHPGAVAIYNAATGHLISTLTPDKFIATALHLIPPAIATPMPNGSPADRNTSQQAINYAHLLWSPDNKQLAITFSITIATGQLTLGSIATKFLEGVLFSSPAGAQSRVLSHTLAHDEFYSGLWNLADGSYIALSKQAPAALLHPSWGADQALIPPALRYQWTDAGTLHALAPLNATSAPAAQAVASVGLPDGGKEFTVWQPGVAQIITQDNAPQPQPLKTTVETWQSSFSAWSADGKYLFAGSGVDEIYNWRLALTGQPVPDSATLHEIGLADAPILPARDAGLAAALRTYHDVNINVAARNTLVNLAWRPDGKQLAVEAQIPHPGNEPLQPNDFSVSVYDCATGKILGRLTPKLTPQPSSDQTVFLRWSPDGAYLLLYTSALRGAQVWGSKDLPR